MTRAACIDLAAHLTLDILDTDSLERFYDEALYVLGDFPLLLEVLLLDVDALQGTFTVPDTHLKIHQCWYDDRVLEYMTHAQLLAFSPLWESERGVPIAYTDEHQDWGTFKLYPLPASASVPMLFAPGGVFGQAFPHGHVALLAATLSEDVPVWLELPVALSILIREYSKASPHTDPVFAAGCRHMAEILMAMVQLPPME